MNFVVAISHSRIYRRFCVASSFPYAVAVALNGVLACRCSIVHMESVMGRRCRPRGRLSRREANLRRCIGGRMPSRVCRLIRRHAQWGREMLLEHRMLEPGGAALPIAACSARDGRFRCVGVEDLDFGAVALRTPGVTGWEANPSSDLDHPGYQGGTALPECALDPVLDRRSSRMSGGVAHEVRTSGAPRMSTWHAVPPKPIWVWPMGCSCAPEKPALDTPRVTGWSTNHRSVLMHPGYQRGAALPECAREAASNSISFWNGGDLPHGARAPGTPRMLAPHAVSPKPIWVLPMGSFRAPEKAPAIAPGVSSS